MQLLTMHKILITTAITGGTLFGAWSVYSWSQTGDITALVTAALSGLITVGMGLYLRNFVRKNQADRAS